MTVGSMVYLFALREDDSPKMYEWINNRDEVINNAPYKPVSSIEHVEWFNSIQKRSDVVIFGIRLRETDRLIGSCQLHSIHNIHRSAELQVRIGDVDQRGKGFGTIAVKLLLHFGFKDLNLNRISLHVLSTNQRAIHLYKKIGFIQEGVLRQAAFIDGIYIDMNVMSILRDQYMKS